MFTPITRIVATSSRYSVAVLSLSVSLMRAALVFIAQNFAMTADTAQLISQQLPWRQRERVFEASGEYAKDLTDLDVEQVTQS